MRFLFSKLYKTPRRYSAHSSAVVYPLACTHDCVILMDLSFCQLPCFQWFPLFGSPQDIPIDCTCTITGINHSSPKSKSKVRAMRGGGGCCVGKAAVIIFSPWLLLTNNCSTHKVRLENILTKLANKMVPVFDEINNPSHQSKSGRDCICRDTQDAYSWLFHAGPWSESEGGVSYIKTGLTCQPQQLCVAGRVWSASQGGARVKCWFARMLIHKGL